MPKSIASILVFAALSSGALAAVQVTARVDASRPIYADSVFNYSIIVANGPQPENVDLAPLKSYNPSNPSAQNRMFSSNGQATSYNILTYELIAPAPGEHTIPSIAVTVSGTAYKTNPVSFTVVEAGTSQQIDARMELSDSSCYVGQPVVLTFSFFVWTDIVRNEMIANTNFRVPILDSDAFYIEEVDSTAPPQQPLAQIPVNGRPQPVMQDQMNHNGVDCVRVRFSKVLIPKQAGDFSLEAAAASTDLAVAQAAPTRRGMLDSFFGPQYEYKRFNARTQPLALKVLPLPDSGKPADFYGLVGNYTVSASAAPVQVNVGDPIALTIRIGGSPYLKPVQWPHLESIDGFADFKIPSERADGEIASGQKIFTQTIRAGSDAVTQIPPIPLSFFDASSGQYKTVYSDPIPLDVAATRTITGADIETNTQFTSASRQVQAVKEGLSANFTGADALVNQQFHLASVAAGSAFWALWAGPAVVLVLSLFGRAATNKNPQRIAARRRKAACSVALRCIRKMAANPNAGPEAARVLKQYIADRFSKVAGALTAEDARRLIADATGDQSLADRFRQITERAEAAAYSPSSFAFDAAAKTEMTALLRQVDAATRSSRPQRPTAAIKAILFCAVVASASQANAAMSRDDLFLTYTRANQSFAQANEQSDPAQARALYDRAILDYESIIEQGGVRNAKLYYNLANACLLTDDLGRAILNYRRALWLDASNPDILKNLAFARSKQIDRIPVNAQKKVLERLFFWHYDFSMRTRFLIGGVCFAALCLYLAMRIWLVRLPRLLPLCVLLGFLAAAMAVSIALETVHNARYRSGVIVAAEVIARQGDGLNYPESFSQPLHAGLEFELIEQRPEWLHIALSNGQQTWIPANAADLI